MRFGVLLLSLLAGCAEADWSLALEEEPGGVLFGGHSTAEGLHLVGGHIQGIGSQHLIYNDGRLCQGPTLHERAIWWAHGATDDAWYGVGERGAIVRVQGDQVTDESVDTEATLFGVWDEGDITWAVGGVVQSSEPYGEIWRRSEGRWELLRTESAVLFKVWNGWFMGDHIGYRLDGDTFAEAHPDTKILTVSGRSSTDVWAVGGDGGSGRVLHWESDHWADVEHALGQPINGVWTAPGQPVHVAGNYGVTAVLDDSGWAMPDPFDTTLQHLHGVAMHQGEVFYVGGDLFNTGDNSATIVRYGQGLGALSVQDCGG